MAGFADDGDGVGGHEEQDWGAGVGAADAEVVQAAGVAQGEFAEWVDGVVADAELRVGLAGGGGFGSGQVGLFGGEPAGVRAVSACGVVDDAETVEQVLQFGQCGMAWVRSEPVLEGLVETFDFALVWGWPG